MNEDRPILNVWGAEHIYRSRRYLKGIDLTLRAREIYAMLGPAGAGKATLVQAICGRIPLSAGDLALMGQNPRETPICRSALGLVPHAMALYDHMTVRENLFTFGRMAGVHGGSLRDGVAQAMNVTRIADLEHEPVGRLSEGDQRRVNIACAILHRPHLLILDEPSVGSDPVALEALYGAVRDLRDAGMAILLVTRDLDLAGELADRVGFMRDGRKVLEGPPRQLIAQAFGEEMEILVQLDEDPDGDDMVALAAAGLERRDNTNIWATLDAGAYTTAARLDRDLRQIGVIPREIRVRQPSLANLFSLVADWQQAA